MKIGTKIFLSFILIAVISAFLFTYSAIHSISERYSELAENEILKLKNSIENKFYSFLGELSRKSAFISELNEVINNMDNPDEIETDIELKAFFLSSINTIITDSASKIICQLKRSDNIEIDQHVLNNNPFFEKMESSLLRKIGIVKIGKKISILSVSPIVDQESFEKIGNTILEQVLDSEFADKIRDNYRSEIIIFSDTRKVGTTFVDSDGERFYPGINHMNNGDIQERNILGNNYIFDSFPIEDYKGDKIGKIMVFLNINKIILVRQAGTQSIIRVTMAVIIIIVLLSIVIGRRLSKPILNLSKSAKAISEGKFDINIAPTSRDEIGELTVLFNEMAHSIKTQTEQINHISFYLKNIIDSMPSILAGIDSDGIVTQWNSEAEKKTGIGVEDAVGRPIEQLFPQFSDQLKIYKKSISDRIPYNMEKVSQKTDGERQIQYTDIMIYPLISNGVAGAVIRMDDVSERVRMAEIMVQTEKMMSVGGLAAGMAHEINNPLGGILIGVQNIQRRIAPDFKGNLKAARANEIDLERMYRYLKDREVLDFIEGIQEAGERASTIVDNMLSFSRQSKSDFLPVNLIEIIDKTLELAANDYNLKKNYDFKHLKIVKNYDSNIPDVPCVKTEIQQVILNLLKNAVQSMFDHPSDRQEEPILAVSIAEEEEMVRIEIEDNGCGIDPDTAKRIFEPFFTTKEVGSGTGLGLSVSYFIITNIHKGSMFVESTPGVGTKFTIKIPMSQAEPERNGES